jgi:hypothetical protein
LLTAVQINSAQPIVASWCNWLTRRPLKAESSGSIPDDATKKINNLAASDVCNSHCSLKIRKNFRHPLKDRSDIADLENMKFCRVTGNLNVSQQPSLEAGTARRARAVLRIDPRRHSTVRSVHAGKVAAEAITCSLQVEGIGVLWRISRSPEEQAELTAQTRRGRMELLTEYPGTPPPWRLNLQRLAIGRPNRRAGHPAANFGSFGCLFFIL